VRSTHGGNGRALTVISGGHGGTKQPHKLPKQAKKHATHKAKNPTWGRAQALAFASAHGYIPSPPAPSGTWATTYGAGSVVPSTGSSGTGSSTSSSKTDSKSSTSKLPTSVYLGKRGYNG
jgi:hypothetical protein